MKISVYINNENDILSLCADDFTGNTGWRRESTDQLGLDVSACLFDEHGAPMYKLVDGVAVERSIVERAEDWIYEYTPEIEVDVKQLRADVDYIAMETGVEL